jgi:hypothetical protein
VGRRTTILPHVGDYNKGEKNSIIIIDNASIHWGSDDDTYAPPLF